MKAYNFSVSGLDFGMYWAADEASVKEVFAQDAGYKSWEAMCEQAEEFGGNNVEFKEQWIKCVEVENTNSVNV